MNKLLLGLVLMISASAQAEVYRWTDANGKVHFGDKKVGASAENITEKVSKTNVDTSTAEHQKLESIFRKENDADREYKQQQAQPNRELLRQCAEAKQYLNTINGRVYFVDKDGKEIKVTEEERKQRVIDVQQEIKEHCSN
jgi:3-oxoacyl-ACP reductase-like protein